MGNNTNDYILGLIAWVVLLIFTFGIIWLSVFLFDSSFLSVKEEDCIVTNKYIVPSKTTTTYINSGKTFSPIIIFYPETYNIQVKLNDSAYSVIVNKFYYNNVNIGQKIRCKYTNGRITNSFYIKELN